MSGTFACFRLCLLSHTIHTIHGPLTIYANFRFAHAPGMPGTFSSPPRASDPDMHHGTCATYVPWCMPGSLISGFLWSRYRGKRARHSRRMLNPQLCVSGKRPMHASEREALSSSGLPIIWPNTYAGNNFRFCYLYAIQTANHDHVSHRTGHRYRRWFNSSGILVSFMDRSIIYLPTHKFVILLLCYTN